MLILGIDTSAVAASAAVCEFDDNTKACKKVLAEGVVNTSLNHSRTLMPLVEALLEDAELTLGEMDMFAVTAGPGSFTGLRISVSAVKGMAFALNKPCVPVSALEGLAYNATAFDGIICAAMDARCNQVYNALFRSENGIITRITEDRALLIPELQAELLNYSTEKIMLIGDGAELAHKTINGENVRLAPPQIRYQNAASVCIAANTANAVPARELMPSYLRLPQAERERLQKERKI